MIPSEDELKPYFKFENVREGIFYVANRLYGITFTQLHNVPVPHPEAQAFECRDADGSTLGIIFMDMFARPGFKRGGAWCGGYREQYYKDGERVIPSLLSAATLPAVPAMHPHCLVRTRQRHSSTSSVMLSSHSCRM